MKHLAKKTCCCLLTALLILTALCPAVFAYEQTYPIPELTGNQAVDIVAIARSQVGYSEDANGGTAYGKWLTQQNPIGIDFTNRDWCCTFFIWCANQAGIPKGIVYTSLSASVDLFFNAMRLSGASVHSGSSAYTPQCGDFVFYSYNGGSDLGHIAITDGAGNYIHANYGNKVQEKNVNYVHRTDDGKDYYPVYYVSPKYKDNRKIDTSDREPPVITAYTATDITPAGFTVTVTATDNAALARSTFTVWRTDDAEQKDMTVDAGTLNGDTFAFYVDSAKHNGWGDYNVEITVYDLMGNNATLTDYVISVPPDDSELPVISDVNVTDVTWEGFTLTCTVTDNTKVKEVKIPAWTEKDGADDLVWHTGTLTDNTFTCRVQTNLHNGAYGQFIAQIYAYDAADNMAFYDNIQVKVPPEDQVPPAITNVRITDVDATGFLLTASVSDASEIGTVSTVVLTSVDKADAVESEHIGKAENGILHCRVDVPNHAGEDVAYKIKLTVRDVCENESVYKTSYEPETVRLTHADPDGDGEVTRNDAFLALLAAAGQQTLSNAQIKVTDLNGDGKITAADARLIRRIADGIDSLS